MRDAPGDAGPTDLLTRTIRNHAGRTVKESPNGSRKKAARTSYYRGVMQLATLPFFIGVAPLIGWWLGRWVDGRAGTDWIFQAIGLALGIVAAIRETIRAVRRAQRDLERK